MEHQDSLKRGTVLSQSSYLVQNNIQYFSSDGISTSRIIVGGVFFSGQQRVRPEQPTIRSSSYLVNSSGIQVHEHWPWDVILIASLLEKTAGCIGSLLALQLAIGLDSMLQAEQFPTSIAYLNTSLTHMDRDEFPHSSIFIILFLCNLLTLLLNSHIYNFSGSSLIST
jgi:hypothetical protein